uniref:Putative secreted protein n=1 Tax=Anopheles darlingi TaxID=43151 RepID=A0A2M4DML5_ANODA
MLRLYLTSFSWLVTSTICTRPYSGGTTALPVVARRSKIHFITDPSVILGMARFGCEGFVPPRDIRERYI